MAVLNVSPPGLEMFDFPFRPIAALPALQFRRQRAEENPPVHASLVADFRGTCRLPVTTAINVKPANTLDIVGYTLQFPLWITPQYGEVGGRQVS